MAKRELSSTLRNLKFMQRATQREEKKEEDVKPAGDFIFPASQIRKCMIIMEGDPHPGAIKGRMSFQSFNPSIDKLNEASANPCQPAATSSGIQSEKGSFRENGSSMDEAECSNTDKLNCERDGDHKRKLSEVVSGKQYPNKSPKVDQGDQLSSPNKSKGSFKKPKGEKLDWNILRPTKNQNKRG
ncbi:uncharacterized protein Pyn_39310 [Prunus yedoensis var. nudiflora]|uniref:M-phase phosphoprotein 6 n=1 Tax=Prunus yedoensis var. nudiflora TaxID=2094558 RepID=A0A314UQG4_PRUYE|nr:uncharacterized protein Pyn_39310 [Prunus yedoensis var. nudiflora]